MVDNLAAHRTAQAQACLPARRVQLVYLPPYSPDFNPIELCWATVKQALRAAKARTFEALVDALGVALRAVSPAQVQAGFAHCGYQSA